MGIDWLWNNVYFYTIYIDFFCPLRSVGKLTCDYRVEMGLQLISDRVRHKIKSRAPNVPYILVLVKELISNKKQLCWTWFKLRNMKFTKLHWECFEHLPRIPKKKKNGILQVSIYWANTCCQSLITNKAINLQTMVQWIFPTINPDQNQKKKKQLP